MSHGRRTSSAEDRLEEKAITDTLKVSSYLDEVLESIHTGARPKVNVPNYRKPTPGEALSQVASEAGGINMDFDAVYSASAATLGDQNTQRAMEDAYPTSMEKTATFQGNTDPMVPNVPSAPRFTISRHQAIAIKKFPALIEFLGGEEGEIIANVVNEKMNVILADRIQKNSYEANECALGCKADKQNLKQYFGGKVGDKDWLCIITASGPFRGDEAIYYGFEKKIACDLRKSQMDDNGKYRDVGADFNII